MVAEDTPQYMELVHNLPRHLYRLDFPETADNSCTQIIETSKKDNMIIMFIRHIRFESDVKKDAKIIASFNLCA